MCFMVLYKVLRRMLEWAMSNKGIPEDLVKSLISLYEEANTSHSGL